ncbi:MAG: PQQ-like beta-propeller repeat protein [Verrucomicrobia subdivision 3 bacterium]|nr:PQQ-like beta-propeller repeat protein [Limisphaerales bacterium]
MRVKWMIGFVMALAQGGLVAAPADQNWPQWRGPLGTGVAPHADPPVKWSETQNVKWKSRIPGFGTSTPIIWDNLVLIHTAISTAKAEPPVTPSAEPAAESGERPRRGGGGRRSEKPTEPYQFTVVALDRATGNALWQKNLRQEVPHEGHHPDHGFASASPVTDGQQIISYFGSRGLYCLDMKGNVLWQKDLGKMQTRNSFGEGSSPALQGNVVVVNWDHEGADFIAAFDKLSGKELWRQPRSEPSGWSTPLVVKHDNRLQVIVNGTEKIRSYDLATGRFNWECGGMTANAIPTPVAGHGMAFVTSGFRGSALLAIKLGRTGDLTGTDAIAWSHNKGTPYVPSPLLYDNVLYFFAGNNATLSCFDAKTGKANYEAERLSGMFGMYASPVGAAGRVYIVGRDGGAVVLRKSGTVETLATNKLDDKFDASPAAVGKELFLRGHDYVYCIAESVQTSAKR